MDSNGMIEDVLDNMKRTGMNREEVCKLMDRAAGIMEKAGFDSSVISNFQDGRLMVSMHTEPCYLWNNKLLSAVFTVFQKIFAKTVDADEEVLKMVRREERLHNFLVYHVIVTNTVGEHKYQMLYVGRFGRGEDQLPKVKQNGDVVFDSFVVTEVKWGKYEQLFRFREYGSVVAKKCRHAFIRAN